MRLWRRFWDDVRIWRAIGTTGVTIVPGSGKRPTWLWAIRITLWKYSRNLWHRVGA